MPVGLFGKYADIPGMFADLFGRDESEDLSEYEQDELPGAEEEDYDTLLRKVTYQLKIAESQGIAPGDILLTPDGPGVPGDVIENFLMLNPGVRYLTGDDIPGQIDDALAIHQGIVSDVDNTYDAARDYLEDTGNLDQQAGCWGGIIDQVGDGVDALLAMTAGTAYAAGPGGVEVAPETEEEDDAVFRKGFGTRAVRAAKGVLDEIARFLGEAAIREESGYTALGSEAAGITQALGEGAMDLAGEQLKELLAAEGERALSAGQQQQAFGPEAAQKLLSGATYPLEGEYTLPRGYDESFDDYLAGDVTPVQVVAHMREQGLTQEELGDWLQFSPHWTPEMREAVEAFVAEKPLVAVPAPTTTDPMPTPVADVPTGVPTGVTDGATGGPGSQWMAWGPQEMERLQVGTPDGGPAGLGNIPRGDASGDNIADQARAAAAAAAAAAGGDGPPGYAEDLRAIYYNIMYARPGAGRSDIKPYLEPLYNQSISLFFMHKGLEAWPYIYSSETLGDKAAKETLEGLYRDFLLGSRTATGEEVPGFIDNPSWYRSGSVFRERLNTVTRILGRLETEPEALNLQNDPDFGDGVWVEGIFGGTGSKQKKNREDLIKMYVTGGGQGYYSQQIHKSLTSLMEYYENIGRTPGEIFAAMIGLRGGAPTDVDSQVPGDPAHQPDLAETQVEVPWQGLTTELGGIDPLEAGGSLNVRQNMGERTPWNPVRANLIPSPPMSLSEQDRADILSDFDMSVFAAGREPAFMDSVDEVMRANQEERALLQGDIDIIRRRGAMPFPEAGLEPQGMVPLPGVPPGVDPTLSDADIADILMDFDLSVSPYGRM